MDFEDGVFDIEEAEDGGEKAGEFTECDDSHEQENDCKDQ